MIEDELKNLIIEKYGSLRQFSFATDIGTSTISTILQRGINNSTISNVIKICDALNISADALTEGMIVPRIESDAETDVFGIIQTAQKQILTLPNATYKKQLLTHDEVFIVSDMLEAIFVVLDRMMQR